MLDASFFRPALTTFRCLDDLGLELNGQLLEADRAVLACRVLKPDDGCPRSGSQFAAQDTAVTRQLAHAQLGWRPEKLLVTVRRYRCTQCGHLWHRDTTKAAPPAKISQPGLVEIVIQ